MIDLVIFTLHMILLSAAFTYRWQEEGVKEGMLAVFFVIVIFFVGWSMSSFILRAAMQPEGLATWLDRDTLSLLMLAIGEAVFYYFFLKSDSPHDSVPDARA
jgi:hypothetical protein